MAFEVFSRKRTKTVTPAVTITYQGRIKINQHFTAFLEKQGIEDVLLLWDAEQRKIGIQPAAQKDTRSYHVPLEKKKAGVSFSAKTFLDHINLNYDESKTFLAEWNEKRKMFEVQLPPGVFKKKKQLALPSRHRLAVAPEASPMNHRKNT